MHELECRHNFLAWTKLRNEHPSVTDISLDEDVPTAKMIRGGFNWK